MRNLNQLSERELNAILNITKTLADASTTVTFESADFDYSDPDLAQAERQGKALAERINKRGSARSLYDETDDDRNIREQIRDWMRRTKRTKILETK